MSIIDFALNEKEINSHKNAPSISVYDHSIDIGRTPQLHWYRIDALGFGSESCSDSIEQGPKETVLAAHLMAAGNEPFSLLLQRTSCEDKIVFAAGSADENRIPAVLRAAFGTVKCKPFHNVRKPVVGYCAAGFKPVKADADRLDLQVSLKDSEVLPWADEIARMLAAFPGIVRLDFYPSKGRCGELLRKSQELRDEITGYTQTNISVSENRTVLEEHSNIVGETVKEFFEYEQTYDAPGATVSWNCQSASLDDLNTIEEYYSKLFRSADIGGWIIDFSVSADIGIRTNSYERDQKAGILLSALSASIMKAGYCCEWKEFSGGDYSSVKNKGLILPSELAAEFISFPTLSFYGFERRENRYYNVNVADAEDSVRIAQLLQYDESTGVDICLPKEQINRHVFVCGMTGSGKTNTVHHLLSNIGDLPFLVIEPVKGEYRSLAGAKTYTMTAGSTEALRLNPFWFPQGSNLQYHIDCIKQIISSAFDLYAAMPNILEQCLNRVYQHCGWDLIQGTNYYTDILPEDMLYPTFSDLCIEIDNYLKNSDFGAETKGNYKGALLTRLQSFTSGTKGILLNTKAHICFENFINNKIVISLDSLADDSDKSIVMGVVLAQYYQFLKIKSKNSKKQGLRHITVIEEAHHLFAADSSRAVSSAEGGSGQSSSQDFVKTLNNMLAEIRAYNEGFIIVDQSPSALHPAVLKNTGVKIVHRIDYGVDIESIRDVLLLDDDDNELAALEKGQALMRFGGMRTSAKVYVPRCKKKDENPPVADEDIRGNSIVNHLLEDDRLSGALKPLVRKLLQQLLFDSLSNFCNAYDRFYKLIEQALIIYGHNEITASDDSESILSEYILALLPETLDKVLPAQYSAVKLICLFVERFLKIANETENHMFTTEVDAFEDYRRYHIWSRMNRFWSASNVVWHRKVVRALGGPCPEVQLISEMVQVMMKTTITLENRMKCFENILANGFFLIEPLTKDQLFGKTMRVFDEERKRNKQ